MITDIGNPYDSPIDYEALRTSTNINDRNWYDTYLITKAHPHIQNKRQLYDYKYNGVRTSCDEKCYNTASSSVAYTNDTNRDSSTLTSHK